MKLFSRNYVEILNKNLKLNQQKLGFLKNLAKANGYSYLVTADGGKFILKHKVSEESEQDQYEYSYIGGDGKVRNFENEHAVFSIDFWNSCNFNRAQNYLYDRRLLAIFTPILDKLNFSPSLTDPYDKMQKAVLLSPYSACQHGVTEMERKTFVEEIYKLGGDDKINTLKALKSLSSNFIAEENKAERNLSFKANDEIYFDHSRGKDVASAPQESGRVFAENKFNEFKKKAEALPAEGVSDSSIAPTDYVEFHKIENYFDEDEFPLDQADSAGSVSSKDRTAIVIFHANKKENSQTVISGDNIKIFEQKRIEIESKIEKGILTVYKTLSGKKYPTIFGSLYEALFDPKYLTILGSFRRIVGATLKDADIDLDKIREEFIRMQRLDQPTNEEQKTLQLLRLFLYYNSSDIEGKGSQNIKELGEGSQNIKELFEMGIENKSTDTIAEITSENRKKIKKLVNYKIANDFLECKIESQEQPINLVRKQEEVKLINDLIIASKEKLSPDNYEDQFDNFIKVFNYNFGKVGNAKLNSEEQYDKTHNSKKDQQYHSAKNIFQAGISIRRDKEHPHLVDIVRVISEGEDPKKSPNIQFVAIKNEDAEGNEIALTIKRNNRQETITNKVFFRKVVLANDGEVRFSSNIYYYDSAGKRKRFNIDQIIKNDKRNEFLEKLGMLKIRATNVKIANNEIEVTGSKMSALNNSDIFSEQSLIDRNLSKELENAGIDNAFISPDSTPRRFADRPSTSPLDYGGYSSPSLNAATSPREPSLSPRLSPATSPRCTGRPSSPLPLSSSNTPATSPRPNAGPLSSRP